MTKSGAGDDADETLRVGLLAPPRTLNPREAFDLVSAFAVSQIFETPFAPPKGDGPAVPILFASPLVTMSDGTRVGRIRNDARFSDGTPLTAQLLAASLGAVTEVTALADIRARGDEVVFTPTQDSPRFDLVLTQTHCGVAALRGGRLVGTGPYMLAPNARLDDLRLVRNPYARQHADIERVTFVVHPPDKEGRPRSLVRALESGEIDFTTMLSRTDAAGVQGVRKLFQPSNSTAILYLNVEKAPLDDVRVRRAIAQGIDRVALAAISYANPLAFVAGSLLPPSMGTARDRIVFDRQAARDQLAALASSPAWKTWQGAQKKLRLVVVWAPRPYLPQPQLVGDLIAAQLGEIGLDVEVIVPKTADAYFAHARLGDYELLLTGWVSDTPDPADFLDVHLRSGRVPSARTTSTSAVNRGRLRSREMDEALRKLREEPTAGRRDEVVRLCAELCPLVPLLHGPNVVVHAFRLRDLEVSAQGVPWFHTGRLV